RRGAAPVETAAPAPNCGAPETSPAARPGTNTARPNTAIAAKIVDAACVSVISPLGRISVPNSVAPMPTTIASTISLMPAEITLPSTRSARNAVCPNSANGTSTKPANTVNLNSMMVMKSWTLSTNNARSTISHASSSTPIVTKFVKNDVMPMSSPAFSNNGRDAVNPVEATNPGRIRSVAESDAPEAFNPRPAND